MTVDKETNILWLADTLIDRHPDFFRRFRTVLRDCAIEVHTLPGTRDIWARDYMPIQVERECFVQFTYRPDYLRHDIKFRRTISNVDSICTAIGLRPHKSSILVDGGNVVRSKNKVIM